MRKLAAAAASSTSSKEENDPRKSLLHAAERTMAQSVDDLQNLKAANDALRNDLEKMKKQRDADAESHRKALAESNAETAAKTRSRLRASFGLSAEKAKSKVSQACEKEGDDVFSTSFLSLFPVVVVVVVVSS